MKIESMTIHRVRLPLVRPFRTSFGTESERDIMLIEAHTDLGIGWGECVAGEEPFYNEEYVESAQFVTAKWLWPMLRGAGEFTVDEIPAILHNVKGHRSAKAAVEMALLDAWLRHEGRSLAAYLGGVRTHVDVGVSVGIPDSIDELVGIVEGYVADGYARVKLKVEPGFDVEPVAAVRRAFPNLRLQCDANASYRAADMAHLRRLDEFGMLLIEQPFEAEDVASHAVLARLMETPICLDESIHSLHAAVDAVERGAADIINIKVGRIGGILEARAIHDHCAAHGVPVWCGGMLESGVGRAANVALASMPNFLLPGDISASERYFTRDITEPFVLEGSTLAVLSGPGLGVEVDREFLVASGAVSTRL